MQISFSTPVVNMKTNNGYGHAGTKIINSLKELGHEVGFQHVQSPVQLNFSQPDYFKLHRNQYQISYTPWESTVIPQKWRDPLSFVDEIWTTSDWCANVFTDNGYKDVRVYPHGIDPVWAPRRRRESDVIKFLHVGEPAPRKAGQMVVDAFAKLFGNDRRYSLTLKVYKHNIYIIDTDMTTEELVKLYHDHDVLVYPSYGEGFGFIPLQALATGMPTICTSGWAHYENYIGPLKLKSELIDSPWPFPHEGKVYEPNYQHLLELMRDVTINFNAYSGFYYAQSTKIHKDYNWLQLTNNAFDHIFKKFS